MASCGRCRAKVSESLEGANARLVPIANYLLPPPSAGIQSGSEPAPFRRPSDLKRSSLPVSNKTEAELRQEHETIRSPSPETIARMAESGPAMSPASQPTETFERRLSYPPVKEALESQSPTSARPRSPKPEADGRLDRGFKFPLKGQKPTISTQVSGSEVALTSPPMQTPIVHIQAPSTDGPMSAPVGYTPDEETRVPIEEVSAAKENAEEVDVEAAEEEKAEKVAEAELAAKVEETAAGGSAKESEVEAPAETAKIADEAEGKTAVAEETPQSTVGPEATKESKEEDKEATATTETDDAKEESVVAEATPEPESTAPTDDKNDKDDANEGKPSTT